MTLWAALVILVGFSAFFSASETAFSSLNQIRLKSRAEDGDSSAARVLAMAEQYDKLLSTILIGNNIVNIAAASIGTILFTRMLGAERGATVSTIVLTIIVLIFGEVTPKSLAKEMPDKLREMRLLLLEEGHCFRDQALSFCKMSPGVARDMMEGSSLSTLVQMVGAGIGVTLIPQMAIPIETRSAEVAVTRLPAPRPSRSQVPGITWRTPCTRPTGSQ